MTATSFATTFGTSIAGHTSKASWRSWRLLEGCRWLEDRNVLESLEQERELSIQKRGATEVLQGQEISYPFILPWKYLAVDLTGQGPA